jgi:hypothetical protein
MLATTLPPLGEVRCLYEDGVPYETRLKRVCHRGSACLLRVGMTAKRFGQTFLKFERMGG